MGIAGTRHAVSVEIKTNKRLIKDQKPAIQITK